MVKRFLFGSSVSTNFSGEIGLLVLRVFAGAAMMAAHGLAKFPPSSQFVQGVAAIGLPSPELFAWAAALSEALGGALLALGLLTRTAALMIACTMTVAAFGAHANDPFKVQELALLYLTISIAFLAIGSGRTGLDRFFRS